MTSHHKPRYSQTYEDDYYEYRHIVLPKTIYSKLSEPFRLLTDKEWRQLGIIQSLGWQHYMIWRKEPYIVFFRRPKSNHLQI